MRLLFRTRSGLRERIEGGHGFGNVLIIDSLCKGVRIEDDYYVDADGKLIKLSEALPSKAKDVEKLMAGK